jgi:hypothetical protein
MKRERWWIHFKRKRADPIFGSQLRFAKKAAGIDVTRKSTGWNSSKVIDASRIRTVIKTWRPGPARIRKATRRGWAITRSLILLNDCAG